ncbi:MAG TPA: hypothetical protein VJK48_07155 [Chlamydiales bacterium]|nr:MAG: hypothetical protein A3F67_08295 [Verrucomicrobia bacterium RIFCSPHIGHO2_12_FULL_41_10]HLB53467.1 hypothetical protein [Chlamydiales bacterium]
MRRLISCLFLLCLLIFPFFLERSFSQYAIRAPFITDCSPLPNQITEIALSQSYRYLSSGKQSFAFVSEDGQWVIKFFKRKYFQIPLLSHLFLQEFSKKNERLKFYRQSYLLAEKELQDETALLYLHLGPSDNLPTLTFKDPIGISHSIDLNHYPFVVQRKAEPFYPLLSTSLAEWGIEQYLGLVAKRIQKGIADWDHEIEDNFGICEGKLIQLDPGRLYLEERFHEQKRLDKEWWSATHRLRKWLEENEPDKVAFFDQTLANHKLSCAQGIEDDSDIDDFLQHRP